MNSTSDITEMREGALSLKPAAALRARLVDYYEVTKPRMNYLVVATTMVGFYMAAEVFEWWLVLGTLFGTTLTAASASVFNQLLERNYDALMPRTRHRPLPADRLTPGEALAWGTVLGVVGLGTLAVAVNLLTAALGLFTLLCYVVVYTPMKRTSSLCTIVGAVPGAIPPVMGWTAYHNALSPEALALFLILFMWQMPHFLAIAVLYKEDYEKGGFKMLPVIDDQRLTMTNRQMIIYTLALLAVSLAPVSMGMTGGLYMAAAIVLGGVFVAGAVALARTRSRRDARRLFFASIIYLPLLLAAMMIDKV